MEIRRATLDDREPIREIARRAWRMAYGDVLGEHAIDETVADWYSESYVADALERDDTVFLVAEGDDGITGFAHGVRDNDDGDILRIYVHPDHCRQGIGTTLLERTQDELAAAGVDRIKGMVLTANDIGNSFYQNAGFDLVDTNQTEIDDEFYEENVYELTL